MNEIHVLQMLYLSRPSRYSGVWVRNYRSVFRVELSAVEVGCPVPEGAVRQDGVVAGG